MNRCRQTALKLRIVTQNNRMLWRKDKRAIKADQLSFVGMKARGIRRAGRLYGVISAPLHVNLKQDNAQKHPTNRSFGARKIIMRAR